MRALVLAAGLGTRLKPWTLEHPKALVPVAGVPMLERVLTQLENEGFGRIVVNVHHFGDQIISFLSSRDNKAEICISDERDQLLDTGGGILQADEVLGGNEPLLVHNVDILSNAPLQMIMQQHIATQAHATLLTSGRVSSRKLAFDKNGALCGWHDLKSGAVKPASYAPDSECEEAFSGIYIMGKEAIIKMRKDMDKPVFPIMDFFLTACAEMTFSRFYMENLRLLDIGKPDALAKAEAFVSELG